jgi:hypothetical protein
MTIISTKQQQKTIKKLRLKYDPNKRVQYVTTFGNAKYYLKNIEDNFILLGAYIVLLPMSVFYILCAIKDCILSLLPYSLVYTRKKLKDKSNIKEPKFKNPYKAGE